MEMWEAYLVKSLAVTFGLKWHKPTRDKPTWHKPTRDKPTRHKPTWHKPT